eukprot:m.808578 g.808578  ORF g.808578 m.808578 type:complete len:127 (-) comp23381_c1_seq40:2084-2464(-)
MSHANCAITTAVAVSVDGGSADYAISASADGVTLRNPEYNNRLPSGTVRGIPAPSPRDSWGSPVLQGLSETPLETQLHLTSHTTAASEASRAKVCTVPRRSPKRAAARPFASGGDTMLDVVEESSL